MTDKVGQVAVEAFAPYGCPGGEVCEKQKPTRVSPHLWPCIECKAPSKTVHKGVICYRSYSDYCDD